MRDRPETDALEVMDAARPRGAAAGLDVARVSLALVAASLTVLGDPRWARAR